MIPEIIAGLGLGKLSEDIIKKEKEDSCEIERMRDDYDSQIDWCPEMSDNDDRDEDYL